MALHAIHLCSGYGGFELGLRIAGLDVQTACHVEWDPYAAATLVARMEDETLDEAPIWDDLATFDGEPWRGRVDIITAGLPCQPFSDAGARRGLDDERHLWPLSYQIIVDVGPRLVFLENVPGVVSKGWLDHVLADLAALGFDAEWGVFSADSVGAPHRRDRFWLLAHRPRETGAGGLDGRGMDQDWEKRLADSSSSGQPRATGVQRRSLFGVGARPDPRPEPGPAFPPRPQDLGGWERWVANDGPEPAIRRGADGRPRGMADSLHLGGNGLVPAVAAEAFAELASRLGILEKGVYR